MTVTTVYSRAFSTGLGSWAAFGTGATVTLESAFWLKITAGTANVPIGAQVGVSGLVIGQMYQFVAYLQRVSTGSSNTFIGVSGVGGSPPTSGSSGFIEYAYAFVATATTHTLQINTQNTITGTTTYVEWVRLDRYDLDDTLPLGGEGFLSVAGFDTGSVRKVTPVATVTFDGTTVDITEGSVLLDQQQIPYGSYNITFPIDPADPPAIYDPRTVIPVTIAMKDGTTTQGTFEGVLRTRTVDEETWTVSAEVTTEEALVSDYATLTQDTTPLSTHSASLRAIVNYTLAEVGLGPLNATPSNDRNMTPVYDERNLVLNGAARLDASSWSDPPQTRPPVTISRITGVSVSGVTTAIRSTWTGTTSAGGASGLVRSMSGNTYYQGSAWVRSSVSGNVRAKFAFYDADSLSLGAITPSNTIAVTANTWTYITIPTQAAPPGTGYGYADFVLTTSAPAGTTLDVTAAMVTSGNRPYLFAPFFDGNTTDTATYQYDWQSDVGASESNRTALVPEILPEALIWEPGVSAWGFLEPLITGAGLRLFADELGVWRMVNPNTYTVAGTVTPGANLVRASDTIGRDDPDAFATGIVLKYMWTDARDLERVAYDTAGTEERVLYREFPDTPFPGAGAAAAMLARRDGSGHFQNITMVRGGSGTTYQARPYMALTTDLPHIPVVYGRVQSVRFDLGNGLMDIQSTNMDETPL